MTCLLVLLSMGTPTPFEIPPEHRKTLPEAGADGLILADVKVGGRWDGILVIDENYRCIGVYVGSWEEVRIDR